VLAERILQLRETGSAPSVTSGEKLIAESKVLLNLVPEGKISEGLLAEHPDNSTMRCG